MLLPVSSTQAPLVWFECAPMTKKSPRQSKMLAVGHGQPAEEWRRGSDTTILKSFTFLHP